MIDRPLQSANEGSEIDQPILHKGVDPPVNAQVKVIRRHLPPTSSCCSTLASSGARWTKPLGVPVVPDIAGTCASKFCKYVEGINYALKDTLVVDDCDRMSRGT